MSSLRDNLLHVLDNYGSARSEEFAGHPIKKVIKEDIPENIRSALHEFDSLTVKGSAGKGNWTSTPFIAIMDERETNTPKKGVYVDYLFEYDEGKVYLAIDQGYTQLTKDLGKKEGEARLERRKDRVREMTDLNSFKKNFPQNYSDKNLSSSSKVAFLEYQKENFPSEEELKADLKTIVEKYQKYVSQKGKIMANSENNDSSGDPRIFLAPCSNEDAYAHLRDTVIRRVPTEIVDDFSDRSFNHDAVSIWGNREGTRSSWEKIENGDFLLFYRKGEYIYGAEVIDTENNKELAEELWSDDDGDPWRYIIYLKEPFRIDLSQDEINELADYSDNYNLMGFQSLNDEGLESIRHQYGGVREFLQEKKTGPASPETSFIEYDVGSPAVMSVRDKSTEYATDINIDTDTSLSVHLPENLPEEEGLYFPDGQEEEIISQIEASLNAGKHIIFTGPPGTGKTELAKIVAEQMKSDENVTGYQLTTATSDWSTFDTVGGYRPEEDGSLEFKPGHILRRFRDDEKDLRNEILVIDEINRANIDKAFGQLFTVLSDQKVQLPFTKGEEEEEVEVVPGGEFEEPIQDHEYVVPESWKILATMNTYDKTSLYEMSYAFMRRFSFIRVEAPEIPEDNDERAELMDSYIEAWDLNVGPGPAEAVGEIWYRVNSAVEGREIGPAIAKDMLEFLKESGSGEASNTAAVTNYIFPQLEGVPKREEIVRSLKDANVNLDEERLEKVAKNMLQVDLSGEE